MESVKKAKINHKKKDRYNETKNNKTKVSSRCKHHNILKISLHQPPPTPPHPPPNLRCNNPSDNNPPPPSPSHPNISSLD